MNRIEDASIMEATTDPNITLINDPNTYINQFISSKYVQFPPHD